MKLGFIIPATSKGREWKHVEDSYLYKHTIKTFISTYEKTYKSDQLLHYKFYIGIDRGDYIYDDEENIKSFKMVLREKDVDIEFVYLDGIQKGHLTVMWNKLFKIAYDDGCDYFFQCGDDIEFKTEKWISSCIDVQIANNNICLTGPINNNCRILTQSFVSRKHMELFGYYFPPEIINWFCDDWINEVYRGIGRFSPLRKHLCINVGGEPRYDINNKKYRNQAELVNEVNNVMKKQCNSIVKRDLDKVVKSIFRKPSSFSTMCTHTCAFELVGLLLSLSVFHPNEKIYVITDTKTKNDIESMTPTPKLNIVWRVELDKYDGMNRSEMERKGVWSDFQMTKAKVISYALESSPDTLFLDSDIIITDTLNCIPQDESSKDIGVSPAFINQHHMNKYGHYNGGMLWVKNKNVPDDWVKFTKTSRYYDQASIEDLAKKYSYFEFGENYNLQGWRFILSPEGSAQVANNISSKVNDKIYYKNLPLKFIHTHFHENTFKQFNNLIIQHLNNAKMYKILAIIFRVFNKKWILKLPKQPMGGMGKHAGDSYRELATMFKNHHSDIDVRYNDKSIHCWIEPNILTYDRPTTEWVNNEVAGSSLILLGNGDVDGSEGIALKHVNSNTIIKPWIFWPRAPITLEKVLDEHGILSYEDREIESIFIGNIENSVQNKYRKSWGSDLVKNALTEYHCTSGSKHKFTHEEYLLKLRNSKYGLCLRGYGSKCHREVELMAFGTVPIITPEVSVSSYTEPLIENIHYISIASPEELKKIKDIPVGEWKKMSLAGYEWYQRNVHSKNCWKNMITNILYNNEQEMEITN